MAAPIIPRFVRGRLYFLQIANVLIPAFAQAGACSAAVAHRLDVVETHQ